MVVAIYVFVGNSGVLSFGQISFVAVGAFTSGMMTIPVESKVGVLPDLFPILRDHTLGNVPSLVLAALVGGLLALVLGLPLMRLSGPGRGHRDVRACSRSRTTCCASGRRSGRVRRRSR